VFDGIIVSVNAATDAEMIVRIAERYQAFFLSVG